MQDTHVYTRHACKESLSASAILNSCTHDNQIRRTNHRVLIPAPFNVLYLTPHMLLYHSCAYDIICAYSINCRVYHVPDYIQDLSCVYDCRVCMSFVPQATFIAARLRVCVCLLCYTHTLKAIVYTRQSYSRHFHSTAPEGVCVSAVLHAHTQGNHIHTTNDIVLKAII